MLIRRRLSKFIIAPLIGGAVFILFFALLEGLSSVTLFAHDFLFRPPGGLPSRVHMQPDTLVGWVNIPNLRLPNMFGPGTGLSINPQSFRGTERYDSAEPAGKIRVLCSGDSFTFGLGVGDRDTWCARLEAKDARLQTVNMGHSGWGIDQSYLFYQRQAAVLEHSVHVFAFVTDDLRRLRLAEFAGYPKPLFRLENGQLELTQVPVPKPSRLHLWQVNKFGVLEELRTTQLGKRVRERVLPARRVAATTFEEGDQIMLRLFEDLYQTGLANGRTTLFVLLEENELSGDFERRLQRVLSAELPKRGIPFLDLLAEFRRLPAEELKTAFDQKWAHYSPAGNERVATAIYRKLQDMPQVARTLMAAASD